jgi:transposase
MVPATKDGKRYTVDPVSGHCSCPDHQLRKTKCKHLFAVEFTISQQVTVSRETRPDGTVTVTETATVTKAARVTYKQNWTAYNKAQTEEKRRFGEMLNELCQTIPEPEYTFGRPRLPLADMAFACAYKVYTGFSSRRFTCDLKDMQAEGMIANAPHFNSVNNYLANEDLTPLFKHLITMSSLPLKSVETDFAVDSSGFGTSRFIKWFDKKWGREIDAREWVKVHLMVGVRTHIVTTADIAGWETNDNPYFAPLIEQTAQHFQIGNVTADKGYLSHGNLQVVADKGGVPFIPFKSNTATPPDDNSTWSRMWHLYSYNREAFLQHYHQRSNVESTFSMIKAKFGDAVRGKTNAAQVNEVLCKVLCHNICVLNQSMHEFGIEATLQSRRIG